MLHVTADGVKINVKEGTALEELAKRFQQPQKPVILLAYTGEKLRELYHTIDEDCDIRFVTNEEQTGYMTYKRTVNFVFLKACEDVLGEGCTNRITMNYSIGNSTFCEFSIDGLEVNDALAEKIQKKMRELVNRALKIKKISYNTFEARKRFAKQGMKEKVRLFRFRRVSRTNVYSLDGYENYFYGYMAPSTGYIQDFFVDAYQGGIVLQIPRRDHLYSVSRFTPQPKLFHVMQRSRSWSKLMRVDTVGALNEEITNGDINNLILVQEALQEKLLADIATKIVDDGKKVVLIAGPSSSGKTTFSHRLAIQLQIDGLIPHPISLDDYFLDRELSPRDEEGNYNFETIASLDLDLFNEDMNSLLAGKQVQLPTYNFVSGKREYKGNYKKIGPDDVLVIEGIHGLNGMLSSEIAEQDKYKIYVSALSQINIDEHNRIPSSDGRLLRRIVRDARHRGTDAKTTISRWESVRRGEELNIFPYQEEADIMFNSAQIYELAVLKQYAEPLLFQISPGCPEYQESKRLLKFLDYFLSVKSEDIPKTSLLREFIGGSCFET